jgi:hypothetical protein
MRGVRVAGAVSAAVAVFGSLGTATPASASNYGVEVNGTYRATSNGDWARTNDVLINEPTVVQTWIVNSSCTSPISCTGTVKSDQGWTAPLDNRGDYWVVERHLDNWEPCPDGTAAPGVQKYVFWGVNPALETVDSSMRDLMAGRDRTVAPSGNCGINKPLVIELPLQLNKLSS